MNIKLMRTHGIVRDSRKMRSRFRMHYRILKIIFAFMHFCICSHFLHNLVEIWQKTFFLTLLSEFAAFYCANSH